MSSEEPKRDKRRSAIRRPEKNRRVQFKSEGSQVWLEGETVQVGNLKDDDKLVCNVRFDNGDVKSVDFGDSVEWKYRTLHCQHCQKPFNNSKGINQHIKKSHKNELSVSFGPDVIIDNKVGENGSVMKTKFGTKILQRKQKTSNILRYKKTMRTKTNAGKPNPQK